MDSKYTLHIQARTDHTIRTYTYTAVTCTYVRMYLDIIVVGDDSLAPLNQPHGQRGDVQSHPLQVNGLVEQLEH